MLRLIERKRTGKLLDNHTTQIGSGLVVVERLGGGGRGGGGGGEDAGAAAAGLLGPGTLQPLLEGGQPRAGGPLPPAARVEDMFCQSAA